MNDQQRLKSFVKLVEKYERGRVRHKERERERHREKEREITA